MSGPNPYQAPDSDLGLLPTGVASPWVSVEGYLSLLLTVVVLSGGLWGTHTQGVLPQWLVAAVWLAAFLFASVFAVSGIRSNRGGSQFAAVVSSAVILLYLLMFLVIAFH